MARKALSMNTIFVENTTNLDSVTSATNGDAIETKWYHRNTVFVEVSGNTGAVTVTIQGSYDGTKWFDIITPKTYTASNEDDVFTFENHYPFMRTITPTHSNATVKSTITGRS